MDLGFTCLIIKNFYFDPIFRCDRTHLCLSLKGECQFWEIEALQKTQYIEEQVQLIELN